MSLSSRHKQILHYLHQSQGVLSSASLAERCDVSVQTIRKDLTDLNLQGLVKRVHGGVCLPSDNDNVSFSHREIQNIQAKQHIAKHVAQAIPKGSSLFLGIGTTPKQVAMAMLDHPGATVVTNNINAALILSRNANISVHLAGGVVRASDEDTMGESTSQFYAGFHLKLGIFGVGGLNQQGQLLDFTPEEAHINRAIIRHCQECWLVADLSKLHRFAPVVSGHMQEMTRWFSDGRSEVADHIAKQNKVELIY